MFEPLDANTVFFFLLCTLKFLFSTLQKHFVFIPLELQLLGWNRISNNGFSRSLSLLPLCSFALALSFSPLDFGRAIFHCRSLSLSLLVSPFCFACILSNKFTRATVILFVKSTKKLNLLATKLKKIRWKKKKIIRLNRVRETDRERTAIGCRGEMESLNRWFICIECKCFTKFHFLFNIYWQKNSKIKAENKIDSVDQSGTTLWLYIFVNCKLKHTHTQKNEARHTIHK